MVQVTKYGSEMVPELLANYRYHYRYVDYTDADLGRVLPKNRTRSWKVILFKWLLLVVCHNSKILYNEIHGTKIGIVEFIRKICDHILRYDQHTLITMENPKLCSVCLKSGFRRKVYTQCIIYQKYYHKNCFYTEKQIHKRN